MKASDIVGVDLFCGAGGLTHGLERCGFKIKYGVDNNPDCEFAYNSNNNSKFICSDIQKISNDWIKNALDKAKCTLICGCAPCQPFSSLMQKNKSKENDPRWSLLNEYSRIVEGVNPDIVVMENVPQIVGKKPFENLLKMLVKMGYETNTAIIDCERYGIPQKRRRLIMVASTLGRISLIGEKESKMTVYDYIGQLEPLKAGESSKIDSLHRCQGMTEVNLQRIKNSLPGGSWRDWPPNLVCNCHKKSSGASFSSAYSRMVWDEPSPTITTQFYNYGSGRFGHPCQNRALSLREGALLQTFPIDYMFDDPLNPLSMDNIARMIGNAVPVALGEVIGQSIKESLCIDN